MPIEQNDKRRTTGKFVRVGENAEMQNITCNYGNRSILVVMMNDTH